MKDSDISNTIRSIRKNKGLTQEQLAEDAQLNLRTIQRIENNESTPRGDTLKRIADSLKVSENEFIHLEIKEDRNVLLLMSLSQLTFLIFPILGIIVPMAIWIIKKDNDQKIEIEGKLILNFQIIWTTIIFIFLILSFMAKLFHMSIASSVFLPVVILYIVNILIISFNSVRIYRNKRTFHLPFFKLMR